MESFLVLVGLGLLALPVVAVVALVKAIRLRGEVDQLHLRLATLSRQVESLGQVAPSQAAAPNAEAATPPPVPVPEPVASEPAAEPAASPPMPPMPPPRRSVPTVAESAPVLAAPAVAPAAGPSLEQSLADRWLVWLGGVALALAAAFLVKYSLDQGWMSPAVRVVLGGLSGAALVAAGHWLSGPTGTRWLSGRGASLPTPFAVPPALVAAGVAALFASLFAAYRLYDLVAPLVAFVGLAAIAAGAVLLALRHGPFVAALGLVGAYAVPILVSTGGGRAEALFPYLLAITAGATALLRWTAWWWVGWLGLAASGGWVLIWLAGPFAAGDEIVLALFLLAVAVLHAVVRGGFPAVRWLAAADARPQTRHMAHAAALGGALLLAVVAAAGDYSAAGRIVVLICAAAAIAGGRRLEDLPGLPAAAGLALLLTLPPDIPYGPDPVVSGALALDPDGGVVRFLWQGGLGALLAAGGGFAALWNARRPGVWGSLAAAVPLLTLVAAYVALDTLVPDMVWAALALGSAGVALAAAERLWRRRGDYGLEQALGAYAVAVIGGVLLTGVILLRDAWLTVFMALMLPALAWLGGVLTLKYLRPVALALAAAVLVRLVGNPWVLDYVLGPTPVFNWLLYGYGLPAAAFAWAAWRFRRETDDLLVAVLEAGAIAFVALLISGEIRHAFTGALDSPDYDFAEQVCQSLAWLGLGVALLAGNRRLKRPMLGRGGLVLVGLGSVQVVLLQGLADNPLWSGAPVGETVLFNALLPAYALPAVLYGVLAWLAGTGAPRWRSWAGGLALALAFVWLTLEVRHAYAGSVLAYGAPMGGEWWAYSAAWLVYALAVLVAGLWKPEPALRKVGLALLLLVAAKAFLFDMSELTGLWRVLSFFGLGGALIGVGLLYRKLAR